MCLITAALATLLPCFAGARDQALSDLGGYTDDAGNDSLPIPNIPHRAEALPVNSLPASRGKVNLAITFTDDSCLGVEEIIEGEAAMVSEALNSPGFASCVSDMDMLMTQGRTNAKVLSSLLGLGNKKITVKCFRSNELPANAGCVAYGYTDTRYANTIFLNRIASGTSLDEWKHDVLQLRDRSPALFEFGLSHPPPKYYGILVHEITHLLNYEHPRDFNASNYWKTVPLVIPQCAAKPYGAKYGARLDQLYSAQDR